MLRTHLEELTGKEIKYLSTIDELEEQLEESEELASELAKLEREARLGKKRKTRNS